MVGRMKNIQILLLIFTTMTLQACSSEEQIKKELLEKTPIGTEMSVVTAYCISEKLKCNRSDTTGYIDRHTGKVVGVKSIWAPLDMRRTSPLTINSTEVNWGFDKDGHLLDIFVWKTIDAP